MSGLSALLRKTEFKLKFIGDSYSDTSVCPPRRRVKEERRAKDVVMEILLDVVMEKNSLEEKTSLSTHVGVPGPAAWASPPPTGGGTCTAQLLSWTSRSPRRPTR
jgi:hypothetical protein